MTRLAILLRSALLILTLVCVSQTMARSQKYKVTIKAKEQRLLDVFKTIQQQTKLIVFYSNTILNDQEKVSIQVKDEPLEKVLDQIVFGKALKYEVQEKYIVISPKEEKKASPVLTEGLNPRLDLPLPPPTKDISGKVTDAEGNPLVGASIKVKGTTLGTSANADGVFVLKGVDEKAVIEIGFVGYETISLSVGARTSFIVSLKVKEEALQEVVVNKGYYTEKQRYSVGNVAKVTAKDIEKQPVSNPLLALQGRVAGMEITQVNGLPGSAVKVKIRGVNSVKNGNQPLYIIDGVPYLSQNVPGLGVSILDGAGLNNNNQATSGSPMSYINPSDIESIEILKDADATSIYGSRAANGAVLITTKKGVVGKAKASFSYYSGISRITKKNKLLNLRQYLDMRYEAYKNDGIDINTLTPNTNNFDLTVWDTTRSTDWSAYLLGQTASVNNFQANISGGSANIQYLVGSSYQKETTMLPGDFSDQKTALHFNLNAVSTNTKFRFSMTGNYVYDLNQLPKEGLGRIILLPPNAPRLFKDDGTINWEPYGSNLSTFPNPVAFLSRKYKGQSNNLIANITLGYEVLKGLNLRTNIGYNNLTSREMETSPSTSINPNSAFLQISSDFSNNSAQTWIVEPQISYDYQSSHHKVNFLMGSTLQSNSANGQRLSATGFSNDALIENPMAATSVRMTGVNDLKYRYNGVYGRLSYNYKNSLLLNLTARRDGSSRFGDASKFHNYGSVGGGWIFSSLPYISKNLAFLSFGKIRASFGTTGNDQIQDYNFLSLYSPQGLGLPYQGISGLVPVGLANPVLAWEQTNKFEAGIEIGFLNDRIMIGASYYDNRSSNQLAAYRLPIVTGFSELTANQDIKVRNYGWEFTLNTINLSGKAIKWQTSANLSMNKNRLLAIGSDAIGIPDVIGNSLNYREAYPFSGVNPQNGAYEFYDKKGNIVSTPDSMHRYFGFDPSFYGGIQNTISLNGFQVDLFFQFVKQLGEFNMFGSNLPGEFGTTAQSNQSIAVLDRWQSPGDVKPIQRFNANQSAYPNYSFATQSSGRFVDASYIRLKNLSISYDLSKKVKNIFKLEAARIYVRCQNLLTFSPYPSGDPEMQGYGTIPPIRTMTAGIQLTF